MPLSLGRRRRAAISAVATLLLCTACSGDGTAPPDIELTISGEGFEHVSAMLGARCGTLDCHGQIGRPLRLYSTRGLRLSPSDLSGHGGTRRAEHAANFRAVIGLEPEVLFAVVAEGGTRPERLLLLRKPLEIEHHEGGRVFSPDDDGVECVRSFLRGAIDAGRCEAAETEGRPECGDVEATSGCGCN